MRFEPRTFCAWVQRANHLATEPPQITYSGQLLYFSWIIPIFTARRLLERYLLSSCVHLSVPSQAGIDRNDWTHPAVFEPATFWVASHALTITPQGHSMFKGLISNWITALSCHLYCCIRHAVVTTDVVIMNVCVCGIIDQHVIHVYGESNRCESRAYTTKLSFCQLI